ncbi:hypothetical protein BR93DRAFT_941787 [Coniochaeta sp. PMI_546]|nr:hypothetical protein BR93DRAFT_941787 [Coniochaeta sp. PMI_546]
MNIYQARENENKNQSIQNKPSKAITATETFLRTDRPLPSPELTPELEQTAPTNRKHFGNTEIVEETARNEDNTWEEEESDRYHHDNNKTVSEARSEQDDELQSKLPITPVSAAAVSAQNDQVFKRRTRDYENPRRTTTARSFPEKPTSYFSKPWR